MATSLGMDEYAEPDVSTMDPADKKPAFRGLKQYVRDLDANTLPPFLARLCAPDRPSSSYSEEEMLCIFETAAEVHGRSIVPHIGQIVSAVVRIMASGSRPLNFGGSSKAVCTLSRYCIDPLGREEERSETMSSLCRPLSDCLMNANKSVSSGSALCIAALVQSNNWQFASNELVNDVCLKVSGALEEARCQTAAAHVSLVVALVKHSPLTLEPYGRSLIKSGLQVLDRSSTNASSPQMIISSIQMIHSIMRSVNVRTISSEISSVIHALEHCQEDGFAPDICAAASWAAETAKLLLLGRQEERGARRNVSPLGNCSGRNSRKGSNSPVDRAGIRDSGSSGSPRESQSVRGFNGFNSPLPVGQQCTGVLGATRARRRLWTCGSEFSHGMSDDERFHTWAPDYHGITAQSDSADLVKSSRRRSDVLTRIGDPCPACLTPRAANQVCSRRQALSTPRKQLQSLTYCSDSERDGHHRLPPRSALRFTDHPSFQKNSGCEGRKGCCNATQQRRNQPRARTADSLAEDLKFATSSSSRRCCSDSARAPPPPCEERRCDDAAGRRPKVTGIAAGRRRSVARFFICAMVVFAAALLLACWKQDHPSNELYFVVPT